MDFIRKTTVLTDGSKVYDVDILSNGRIDPGIGGRRVCIFSCISEDAADKFERGIQRLIEEYTVETFRTLRPWPPY
jgi:hypothetical protein